MTDRGFRYGMSVFETVAVVEGRLLFWPEHRDRLLRACAAAGFAVPEVPDFPALPGETGMLRIYVTAGDGGPLAGAAAPRVFAIHEAADFPGPGRVSGGLRLMVSRAPLGSVLGGWKTGAYWPHVQALAEARRGGFDEALVCNVGGAVMSCAMANVFVVTKGRVRTPARSEGARDGVVRGWVTEKIAVEETRLALEDVEAAEECFVTNSRLGVFPVAEIDGRPLPSRGIGDWLREVYGEEIQRR